MSSESRARPLFYYGLTMTVRDANDADSWICTIIKEAKYLTHINIICKRFIERGEIGVDGAVR